MGYISDRTVDTAINAISAGAVVAFGNDAAQRDMEQQRDVFEGRKDITNVLTKQQEEDRDEGKPFAPDIQRATDHGHGLLKQGVSMRLKGAYAHYRAGNELECIRHILIALGSIVYALGWKKAEMYLNEQNTILLNMSKEETGG